MFYIWRMNRNIFRKVNIFTFTKRTTTEKYNGKSSLDVNTNVVKDVILFKYDNPKFFKYLNIFALCQFGFWGYLSHFAFTGLRDAPVRTDEDASWWWKINLGENKYKNTIAILFFLIGYGVLTIGWMYTLRSVRYLVLRKGGHEMTIVTYSPFGRNRMVTVPLTDINCKQTRVSARSHLPIKIRNHYLHYMLDMKGEFKNTTLFDSTAGLKRLWR